jgi:hypothetical protein
MGDGSSGLIDDYAHLNEDARRYVELGDEERIAFIRRPRWIGHPSAKRAEEALSAAFHQPKSERMRNVAIVGGPGSGKSTIVKRFKRERNSDPALGTGVMLQAVIDMIMPHEPDVKLFLSNVSEALEIPDSIHAKWWERWHRLSFVRGQLKRNKTRMLVVEDFNSVLGAGTEREQVGLVQMIRTLSSQAQIPFAFTGTSRVLSALAHDEQLLVRTDIVMLHPLRSAADMLIFYKNFLRTLPLRQSSPTDDPEIGRVLAERCEGKIDNLVIGIREAAINAITSKQERIDLPLLRASPGWPKLKPSSSGSK